MLNVVGELLCRDSSDRWQAGAQTAREGSVPSNLPALTGTIDRASASIDLSATWTGRAGANSSLHQGKPVTAVVLWIASSAIAYDDVVSLQPQFRSR